MPWHSVSLFHTCTMAILFFVCRSAISIMGEWAETHSTWMGLSLPAQLLLPTVYHQLINGQQFPLVCGFLPTERRAD